MSESQWSGAGSPHTKASHGGSGGGGVLLLLLLTNGGSHTDPNEKASIRNTGKSCSTSASLLNSLRATKPFSKWAIRKFAIRNRSPLQGETVRNTAVVCENERVCLMSAILANGGSVSLVRPSASCCKPSQAKASRSKRRLPRQCCCCCCCFGRCCCCTEKAQEVDFGLFTHF